MKQHAHTASISTFVAKPTLTGASSGLSNACVSAMEFVAWVIDGQTRDFRWSAVPVLLMAELHRRGVHLRKPPIFNRVGIPGSGGPDWLRNDYEFIVSATNGGRLPWSDNTAMGKPPKYNPGGEMSYRLVDGTRRNKRGTKVTDDGTNGAAKCGGYTPPKLANPGNVIHCNVGGGRMGSELAHENEAPFPESSGRVFHPLILPTRWHGAGSVQRLRHNRRSRRKVRPARHRRRRPREPS